MTNGKRTYRYQKLNTNVEKGGFGITVPIILLGLMVAASLLTYMHWTHSAEKNFQQVTKRRREMSDRLKVFENKVTKLESYTRGDYILDKARRMGLHEPYPGQIVRLDVDSEKAGARNSELVIGKYLPEQNR